MSSSRRGIATAFATVAMLCAAVPAHANVPHTVQPGETLWSVAAANGLSTSSLAAANGLSADAGLIAGNTITIPSPGTAPAAAPGPASTAPQGTGASSSLVSAVGWQESGHNNSMVSSAGAMGIMQVMPGTWDWVEQNLAGRQLDPASRQDNLTAGTLYLNHLIARAGGDEATAIAGYYQGPESVRRIGMLPETQRYVANVQALRGRFGGR
ncbi:MAG TPA: transglycosylase SLT domain-containing protein [Thermoleophilaceae bacterium]|nr:transglycosylase SLT domain-containing protein [Thermoleophilaceae bacterium]